MSVTVTLHVFSGNPDPSWELTDSQSEELADRIYAIPKTTLLKPSGIVGGLGYRGFSVHAVRERRLDPHVYVHLGVVELDRFDVNRIAEDTELEEWLLATGAQAVAPAVREQVRSDLRASSSHLSTPGSRAESIRAVPPYDPGKWNNDATIRTHNNCYNYANDKITNTFAQPGRGSGSMYTAIDCGSVGTAAQSDGQVKVASASSTPAQGHFAALVIWPGTDFHWYRLDSSALWSHKPGQTPVRNIDNSGRRITDPATCDRGPYSVWCSYFHCVPANTRIA